MLQRYAHLADKRIEEGGNIGGNTIESVIKIVKLKSATSNKKINNCSFYHVSFNTAENFSPNPSTIDTLLSPVLIS